MLKHCPGNEYHDIPHRDDCDGPLHDVLIRIYTSWMLKLPKEEMGQSKKDFNRLLRLLRKRGIRVP